MNLITFLSEEVSPNGEITVVGDRARHLVTVCRASCGEHFRVGEVNGGIGEGTVTHAGPDKVTLAVKLSEPPSRPTAVELILALPRPQMLKRILEFCGTVGIGHLYLISTARVERSYFSTPSLRPEQVAQHLRLGMEQGMVTYLPEVSIHTSFPRFLQHDLPSIAERCSLKLVAEPGGSTLTHLAPSGIRSEETVAVAIGPEGGWVGDEVNRLCDFGFQSLTLGRSILRVETAVYSALAQLELMRTVE